MNRILGIVIVLIFVTFRVSAQNEAFVHSSWADAVRLAKEKNQLLLVFISPEKNCIKCSDIFGEIKKDSEKLSRLSKEAIFYELDLSKEDNQAKVFFENRIFLKPSIFFIDFNQNRRFSVELTNADFDLENLHTCIFQWFRNKNNEIELATQFQKKPDDVKVLGKYLEFLKYTCQKDCIEVTLEKYLNTIKYHETKATEATELLIKYQPRINVFFENLYIDKLKEAIESNNLYEQLLVKSLIVAATEYSYSKRILSAKGTLENNSNILKKYNQLSTNFPIVNADIYMVNYDIINGNMNKVKKKVSAWYTENENNLKIEVLKAKDSTLNTLINNFVATNLSLTEEQRNFLISQQNFLSESYAYMFYYFALSVYNFNRDAVHSDFALEYSKKALNLSTNASRLALHGILLSKRGDYQKAYLSLLNAIELESEKKDKIDSMIADEAFRIFLNLEQNKLD